MVVILQSFLFGSLCASSTRASLQSLQFFSAANFFPFEKRIALRVFGVCSKGRAASEKFENVLPPVAVASILVSRMKLSVARRLFDCCNWAEFSFLAIFRPLLPVFELQSLQVFPEDYFSQLKRTITLKVFGLCLKGTAAGKQVGDIPPPAKGSFVSVCFVNLSVRCIFDCGNFAEFPFWQLMCLSYPH